MNEAAAELRSALAAHPGPFGGTHQVLGTTDSTMDRAWAALEHGAGDGHLVVADRQTAGRGSHGRSWTSPAGTDLYLSLLLRSRPLRPTLTLAVALAVAERVDAHGAVARVKWPNDVLVGEAKVAGILCESRSRGSIADIVVGIGLNVNRARFDADARGTSLRIVACRPLDRGAELAALLDALALWIPRGSEAVVDALDERLAWRGERVRLDETEGKLLGVAPSGAVRLRTVEGERSFHAGRLTRAHAP